MQRKEKQMPINLENMESIWFKNAVEQLGTTAATLEVQVISLDEAESSQMDFISTLQFRIENEDL